MTLFDLTVGPTREAWPQTWEEAKKGFYTAERQLRTKDLVGRKSRSQFSGASALLR